MKGKQIESKSFRIIEEITDYKSAAAKGYFGPADWHIARRMIHASGDPSIVDTIRITHNFTETAKPALSSGIPVICDVKMVKTGLSKSIKNVHCFIDEPSVVENAAATGNTRAYCATRHAAGLYPSAIFLIGNAPTALLALLELIDEEKVSPPFVIGIPVGFVMAKESKDLLVKSKLSYVTNLGYKGGTPMTVAALNALAALT